MKAFFINHIMDGKLIKKILVTNLMKINGITAGENHSDLFLK